MRVMIIISTGKQFILLGVLGLTPIIWYRVNEMDKILELLRMGEFQDLLDLARKPERVMRLIFSSGMAGLVGGATYLALPVKLFIGWIPFLGRIDEFVARSFVSGGICALGIGFAISHLTK